MAYRGFLLPIILRCTLEFLYADNFDSAACGASDGFGDMHSVLDGGAGGAIGLRATTGFKGVELSLISDGGPTSGGHLGSAADISTEPVITAVTDLANDHAAGADHLSG